jgi:hypothetical protein
VLELLDGAAAGGAGGQYQHEIEAQLGYTDNGYGARLSADWRSATTVYRRGGRLDRNPEFSDVATVNLRLWDDFTPQRALIERYPFLRGVRVTLQRDQPVQPEHQSAQFLRPDAADLPIGLPEPDRTRRIDQSAQAVRLID